MKEERYFFCPEPERGVLPPDEAAHALRVLRMGEGDALTLITGRGTFLHATVTAAGRNTLAFRILSEESVEKGWRGHLHLALAPTKNMDRLEWFAEKATEIGIDEISLLLCAFSERKEVKLTRLEKVTLAAVKQSRKAFLPSLSPLQPFARFISRTDRPAQRFIAHCYDPADVALPATEPKSGEENASPATQCKGWGREEDPLKPFLLSALTPGEDTLVMIGPEGDFSIEEVRQAIRAGFRPVSLGPSRLRTETAALVAAHLMNLNALR